MLAHVYHAGRQFLQARLRGQEATARIKGKEIGRHGLVARGGLGGLLRKIDNRTLSLSFAYVFSPRGSRALSTNKSHLCQFRPWCFGELVVEIESNRPYVA